jgi:hypothetical protein
MNVSGGKQGVPTFSHFPSVGEEKIEIFEMHYGY